MFVLFTNLKRAGIRQWILLSVYVSINIPVSVGSCVISCQMFVKSEFPLDSALVSDSD